MNTDDGTDSFLETRDRQTSPDGSRVICEHQSATDGYLWLRPAVHWYRDGARPETISPLAF
jgi:hypothetical protein